MSIETTINGWAERWGQANLRAFKAMFRVLPAWAALPLGLLMLAFLTPFVVAFALIGGFTVAISERVAFMVRENQRRNRPFPPSP